MIKNWRKREMAYLVHACDKARKFMESTTNYFYTYLSSE